MRILIVDDERMIVRGLTHILRDLSLEWVTSIEGTTSPKDAVAAALDEVPDIVITDIRMKEMDGFSLIQKLRREVAPLAQYIIVSAYDEFQLVREALLLDTVDYLLKPVKTAALRSALENAANRARELRVAQERLRVAQRDLQRSFLAELLAQAVDGRELSDEVFDQMQRTLDSNAPLGRFACAIIESSDSDVSLVDLARRFSEDSNGKGIVVAWARMGPRAIAVVAASAGDTLAGTSFPEAAYGDVASVFLNDHNLCRHRVAISVGSTTTDIRMLGRVFGEATRARVLKMTSDESWFSVADIVPTTGAGHSRILFDLAEAVRSGRDDGVDELLDQLLDYLEREPKGSGALVAAAQEVGALVESVESEDLDIAGCFSLQEFREAAGQLICVLMHSLDPGLSESLEDHVLAYIMKHLDSHIDMNSVATEVGLSYSYFSALFREKVGKRFSEYLQEVRLAEARRLLETTVLRIDETAYRVGFRSPKHFARVFREHYGMRPSDVRQ